MKRITIIGGGASGTLLAVNLLMAKVERPIAINLLEKSERVGLGVAYSTDKDTHLLNVPASKMGAFTDDVEHFHRWLAANGYDYAPTDFVPRKVFGMYLRAVLNQAASTSPPTTALCPIDDQATDIEVNQGLAQVQLRSGETIASERVVLAFGNFLPPHPTVEDEAFTSAPKYFQNPWQPRAYESIEREDSVLIVGTGLSMVDVVLHLHSTGHRGKITAISTRGLLPAVHRLGFTYPSFYEEIESTTRVTDLMKTVMRHIVKAENDSSDWRAVIDSLRPHTQVIWQGLPTAEKRYFMQHLSRYWNTARHRMPPQAAEILDGLREAGRFQVVKGRLRSIKYIAGEKFSITYAAGGNVSGLSADVLVNCIGSESNFAKIEIPLIQNLLRKGFIRPDDVSLGLKATPDGNIINRDNETSKIISTLGTALKGTLWESTAIPEIRLQAQNLAIRLIAD